MRERKSRITTSMRVISVVISLLMILTTLYGNAFAVEENQFAFVDGMYDDYIPSDDVPAYADVNATSAGVETSANAEVVPMNSGNVISVNSNTLLQMFLAGQLGNNNDIFEFTGNLTAPATAVQGRPGVFTGVVRGDATITGLRLAPRANNASPDAPYRNDIGFVRLLGHGARIEGLTFVDPRFDDPIGIPDWNTAVGNVGMVAGRIASGSSVTIQNVTVRGTTETTNAQFNVGGGRAYGAKRVGGLLGALDGGSTLNINNANVRFTVNSTVTGGTAGTLTGTAARIIPSVGGLIGLTAGNVNVDGGSVHLQTSLTGTVRFQHVGGAIGQSGGVATISNFRSLGIPSTITGYLTNQLGHGNRETGQAGTTAVGNRSVGGFIGSMNGSITFRNATNEANIYVTQGRIGGFIGRTQGAGATRIYNSTNLGRIWNSLPAGTGRGRISSSGGFIGQADGSVYIENSVNGRVADINHASVGAVRVHGRQGAGGFIGITAARGGSNTTLVNVRNYGHIQAYGSRRYVGGFIGHSRNLVNITDTSATNEVLGASVNHGRVRVHNLNNSSGTPNNVGGFIGVAGNVTNITNGINRGVIVASGGNNMAAGGRLRLGGFIGLSMNRVTISDVTNYANLMSYARQHTGSDMGGIIGRAEFRGVRANRRVDINYATNHGNIGFRANNTDEGAAGRTGGLVGFSAHRAAAQGLNIYRGLNTGNVLTSVGGGTTRNHNRLMTAGGIVGELNTINSTINYTMNIGNVTTGLTITAAAPRATVGGIIGRSARNNLTIMNSGNEGVVANGGIASQNHLARNGAGGIIGNIDRGNNTRILRSYNAGSVEGSTQSTGGIVGSVRRRGTLLIEDVYNAGSVMGRQASAGAGRYAQSGNGILGFRRNIRSIYTFRRVINTGNVHGSPIFDANQARATNAQFNTHARVQNRMVYQGVFWDSSVHTGRPQLMTVFAPNNRRHRPLTGLQGVPTSVLTSGGLFEFQSPNWVTRGWIESWIDNRYEDWETYPWLSWQTPGVTRGADLPEFFGWIRPGADHLFRLGNYPAGTNPIFFNQIYPGSDNIAGGHVSNAVRDVRTFIPYGTRLNGQAAGSATAVPPILHRAHLPRAAGNFEATVPQAALNQADPAHVGRLSAGLINPQGVIGFNGNERFDDVVIMGVDGPHYREVPTRTTLITWARISLNGVPRGTYGGILGLESIEVGDRIDITASPGYHPAYRYVTQADVNHFNQYGRLLIRVPMERAPMHLRVALVNSDDEITTGPYEGTLRQIAAARNPAVRRGPEGITTEALLATAPLPLCPVGNLDLHGPTPAGYPDTPPTSVFSTSHLYPEAVFWFDQIVGTGDDFLGDQISLWISNIVNPNAAGTAQDPFFVIMPLECDIFIGDLYLTRAFEDEDGNAYDIPLSHGGVFNPTTPGSAATSANFELQLRNPPLVTGTPTATVGPGSATIASTTPLPPSGPGGPTMGSFNADEELTAHGLTVAQRNNSVWFINASYSTEVRAIQRVPGTPIPGTGLNRTYRATPWMTLRELAEHGVNEELIYALLSMDYEYHIQVNVYERVTVLPGIYEEVPLTSPAPSVYHDKDRGIDGLPYYNWDHVRLPEIYRFRPVRVFEGERLIGRAAGFADAVVYASVGTDGDGYSVPNPDIPYVVPIVMERAPSGRLSGFVLPDLIRLYPELLGSTDAANHNPIPNAAVVLIDEAGVIRHTTSAVLPSGFFYFDNLPAGTYTLFATHPDWGAHITVPTPVVIPYVEGSAVGGNANATIFLDEDLTQGFILLVDVRNIINDENISADAAAVLTYGAGPTVRTSTYYTPFRRINVDARGNPMNWASGSLYVSAAGFRSETLQPVIDDVERPVPNAQFGIVTVPLSPVHTLEISNDPDPLGTAARRPLPIGQNATATHASPNIADRTFAVAPHFGEGPEGNRRPSTFDDVVAGSEVTLTAGSSTGWTFLGWFTAAQVAAFTPGVAVVNPADLPVSQTHTFTMNANAHWVAVWGNQDGIPHLPNDYMLTINNVPEHPVTGTPVRPTGQTASGYRYFNQAIELESGTRADALEFLGWWRGDNVPVPGQNVNNAPIAGHERFTAANGNHQFNMPAHALTYTALWGCEYGYIGGRFNLTINNQPLHPVTGEEVPIPGQSPGGTFSAGQTVNITPGVRAVDDLEFLGWWRGANVPAPGTNVTTLAGNANFVATANHSFTMPAANVTYTALWGLNDRVGPFLNELTINNVPLYPVSGPASQPDGQTPTGSEFAQGVLVALAPGERDADELEFLGWWRGGNVPQPGQNVNTPAIAESPNFTDVPGHSFRMPATDVTYTALWGCEYGYIGGRFDLTINNVPRYPLSGIEGRPTGQTVSGERSAGQAVTLAPGTRAADNMTFIGWWRGTQDVPAPGDDVADFSLDARFVATPGHNFTMPAADVTYTALWGRDGVIGPFPNTLTINNVPEYPVTGTPARPDGQTPSGNVYEGTAVTLAPGSRAADDLIFLGWWRGTTGVPAPGANVNEPPIAGSPNFVTTPGHNFYMPANDVTYTALWGCEYGYIGGRFDLTINNVPRYPLTGIEGRPTGQTVSGERSAGQAVTLAPGTRAADNMTFIGWWRGTEDLPAPGDDVDDFSVDARFVATPSHSFTMPADDVTYTALWGRGGIVGPFDDYSLVINNVPEHPVTGMPVRPTGQTPGGNFALGAPITLAPGSRTADDLIFLGWYRGTTGVPEPGDNLADFEGSSNFVATPGHSFYITGDVTYTALWGCEYGYVGGRFDLTINNVPRYPLSGIEGRPAGQTASGVRSAGQAVTLAPGTRAADNMTFIGWWRGTEDVPAPGDDVDDFSTDARFVATPGHSFTMPADDVTYTALWGRGGIVGPFDDYSLVINNVPEHPVTGTPVRPTGQTPGGNFAQGTPITLAPGSRTADDLIFLGWYRGTTGVPGPGDNLADFEGSPNFVAIPGHNFNITDDVTYTALWGCEYGYVGGRFDLTINNFPRYPLTGTEGRPAGQTASGERSAGQAITLAPGTRAADNMTFIGWWRGTDGLPAPGDDVADFSTDARFVATPGHSFTMPAEDVTYTALWGRYGIVGPFDDYSLVINNVPEHPVTGTPVRPTGQTPGGNFALGTPITLAPGSRTADDLIFLGWYRGTTGVPGPGDNLADFEGSPNFVATPGHSFNITGDVTYTALWGCEYGYVGGRFDLTINNVPRYPLTGIEGRPVGQTESGERSAGQAITLASGNRNDVLGFLGWWRGTENVPGAGDLVADFENSPNFIPAGVTHTFTMPAADVVYTALWGVDGRVGLPDISITVDVDEDGEVTVTVDPDDIEYDVEVKDGNIVVTFPDNPSRDDITVNLPNEYWDYTICDEGDETIVTIIPPPGDSVVELPCDDDPGEVVMFLYHTVTFDLAGGTYSGSTDNVTRQVRHGSAIAEAAIPAPTRVGYDFVRWEPLVPVAIRASATYVAVWTSADIIITVEVDDDGEVTVTVDPDIPYEIEVNDGGEIVVTFPTNPDAEDIEVITPPGWVVDICDEGDETVVTITPPPGDSVVEYPCDDVPGDTVMFLYHTIIFYLNYGIYAGTTPLSQQVRHGSNAAEPAPTRQYFNFGGWAPVFANPMRSSETFVAQWNQGQVTLTVRNTPVIVTPEGQTPVTGPFMPGDALEWNAGTPQTDWVFLGWTQTPELLVPGQVPAEGVLTTPPATMPNSSITVYAVWGNSRGEYGYPDAFTVTFLLYTNNDGIVDAFEPYITGEVDGRAVIVVPVIPGTARTTWAGLEDALGIGNIYGAPGAPGHAFWGWFTGERLTASGRTNATSGLRRPALVDVCEVEAILANIESATTDAAIIALFGDVASGNIDLFAVWSLWGDVDDDDEVTTEDVDLLARYLAFASLGLTVELNLRAADVIVDGDVNTEDLGLISRYLAFGPIGMEIVLGVVPTSQP